MICMLVGSWIKISNPISYPWLHECCLQNYSDRLLRERRNPIDNTLALSLLR